MSAYQNFGLRAPRYLSSANSTGHLETASRHEPTVSTSAAPPVHSPISAAASVPALGAPRTDDVARQYESSRSYNGYSSLSALTNNIVVQQRLQVRAYGAFSSRSLGGTLSDGVEVLESIPHASQEAGDSRTVLPTLVRQPSYRQMVRRNSIQPPPRRIKRLASSKRMVVPMSSSAEVDSGGISGSISSSLGGSASSLGLRRGSSYLLKPLHAIRQQWLIRLWVMVSGTLPHTMDWIDLHGTLAKGEYDKYAVASQRARLRSRELWTHLARKSFLAMKAVFLCYILPLLMICLRGIGQVYLMNSPVSGLLFLAAVFTASTYLGILAVIGVFSSTLTAIALGLERGSTRSGLFGYNGVLCGIAVGLFQFGGSDGDWSAMPQVIGAAALVSSLSTIFTTAVGSILVRHFELAPLTFPFQIATWMWLLGASKYAYFGVDGTILQGALVVNDIAAPDWQPVTYDTLELVDAVTRSFSQVFLLNNQASGILIIVGVFLCSPIAGGMGLLGAVVSIALSVSLGIAPPLIYSGLYGYNSVLAALSIGGMFFLPNSRRVVALTLCASILAVLLTASTATFLGPVGLPPLTFPFCLATWIVVLQTGAVPGTIAVELHSMTVPEDHLRRHRLGKVLSKAVRLTAAKRASMPMIEKLVVPELLCWHASLGNVRELKRLLSVGADPRQRGYAGRTAMHIACDRGNDEILAAIAEHCNAFGVRSALLRTLDRSGLTALDISILRGSLAPNNVKALMPFRSGIWSAKHTHSGTTSASISHVSSVEALADADWRSRSRSSESTLDEEGDDGANYFARKWWVSLLCEEAAAGRTDPFRSIIVLVENMRHKDLSGFVSALLVGDSLRRCPAHAAALSQQPKVLRLLASAERVWRSKGIAFSLAEVRDVFHNSARDYVSDDSTEAEILRSMAEFAPEKRKHTRSRSTSMDETSLQALGSVATTASSAGSTAVHSDDIRIQVNDADASPDLKEFWFNPVPFDSPQFALPNDLQSGVRELATVLREEVALTGSIQSLFSPLSAESTGVAETDVVQYSLVGTLTCLLVVNGHSDCVLAMLSDMERLSHSRPPIPLKQWLDCESRTFVHIAAAMGLSNVVEIVVNSPLFREDIVGSPSNGILGVRDRNGETPLAMAVRYGQYSCANLIVERCSPKVRRASQQRWGMASMLYAAFGDMYRLQQLYMFACQRLHDWSKSTALHIAAVKNSADVAKAVRWCSAEDTNLANQTPLGLIQQLHGGTSDILFALSDAQEAPQLPTLPEPLVPIRSVEETDACSYGIQDALLMDDDGGAFNDGVDGLMVEVGSTEGSSTVSFEEGAPLHVDDTGDAAFLVREDTLDSTDGVRKQDPMEVATPNAVYAGVGVDASHTRINVTGDAAEGGNEYSESDD